jgi:hypothetical protein
MLDYISLADFRSDFKSRDASKARLALMNS